MADEKKKIDTVRRWSPLEVPKIVKTHYAAGVPANFIAEPSTVKSEGVALAAKQLAVELDREFVDWNNTPLERKQEIAADPSKVFVFADVRASETDIGELRLQDLKTEKDYISFKYNILFKALSDSRAKGILFFDEMNLAPNMIKAQFYKIINDKAIGDIPISEGVLCLSAGNESEHSRGVSEDPVPLVLRRGNYFLRPLSHEEFSDYAVSADVHNWIVGYLGFQPGDVHRIEYDLPDSLGQPCPRMWVKLSNILKTNPKMPIDDVTMFATGLVGPAAATKFTAFVKVARAVNIEDFVKDPKSIEKFENEKDISLMYAIIAGMVDKFKSEKAANKRVVVKAALKMSTHIKRAEFGAFLLRSMKASDEKVFIDSLSVRDAEVNELMDTVVSRYGKYMFAGSD